MRVKEAVGIVVGVAILSLLVLVGLSVGAQEADGAMVTLYIGTVTDNENEFVGVAVDGDEVIVYICDGQADEGTVTVAQWFVGTVSDDIIDITTPNDNRVEATIAGDTVTGVFTFADGTVREFVLATAEDSAALFRTEFTIGDETYIGGWLILPDGQVRGAVARRGGGLPVPASFLGGTTTGWTDPQPEPE